MLQQRELPGQGSGSRTGLGQVLTNKQGQSGSQSWVGHVTVGRSGGSWLVCDIGTWKPPPQARQVYTYQHKKPSTQVTGNPFFLHPMMDS